MVRQLRPSVVALQSIRTAAIVYRNESNAIRNRRDIQLPTVHYEDERVRPLMSEK